MDGQIGISRARIEALSQELARANRRRVHDLRESLTESAREVAQQTRTASGDRLELSDEAVALARSDDAESASEGARSERVEELRILHEQGRLNTPERIERAADGLLSASDEA